MYILIASNNLWGICLFPSKTPENNDNILVLAASVSNYHSYFRYYHPVNHPVLWFYWWPIASEDFHRNTSCWTHVWGMKPLLSFLFRSKNSKPFPSKPGLVSSLQNIKEHHSQTNLYFSDAVCRQDKADSHSEAECPCQKEAGEHRCNGELGFPSWQPLLFECTVIWTPGRLGFSFSGRKTCLVFHFLLGERNNILVLETVPAEILPLLLGDCIVCSNLHYGEELLIN